MMRIGTVGALSLEKTLQDKICLPLRRGHAFLFWLTITALSLCQQGFAQTSSSPWSRFDYSNDSVPTHPAGQSATLLPDGRWLLVGGEFGGQPSGRMQVLDSSNTVVPMQLLPLSLSHPRSGHSATVLPDGKVLILGGTDPNGSVVADAELFDPQTQSLTELPDTGLTARSHHTATLLTNGLVLVAGGLSQDGTPVEAAELYNPATHKPEPFVAALETARIDHQASLLAGGQGLLWGGHDAAGTPLDRGELYDPAQMTFSDVDWWNVPELSAQELLETPPQVADSLPRASAADVPLDMRIAVRFSKPVLTRSVNVQTVTLVGPAGAVAGRATAAESGMLAFFSPNTELSPDATYTLFLNGIVDNRSRPIAFSSISFTTRRISAAEPVDSAHGAQGSRNNARSPSRDSSNDARSFGTAQTAAVTSATSSPDQKRQTEDNNDYEDWVPSEANRHGRWQVLGLSKDPILHNLRFPGSSAAVSTSVAVGNSAVTGQVVRLNGLPLAGVRVSIGNQSALTDAGGHFLLAGNFAPGHQVVKVGGTQILSAGWHYTQHFIQVDITNGHTTSIPNPIYLPRVDPATEVSISSPADRELVLTHPAMPGLEVHIPKGAVLREYDGKVVTKLSITPIPVDRAPYPAPINFSVYFTLQPGGAFVEGDPSKAIKIIYPNYQGLAPGTTVDFWNYDPSGGGWKVYGHGVVAANGKQIIPDKNVGFRQIMTFGFGIGTGGSTSPAPNAPVPKGCTRADPVDCATGLFTHTVTDMLIADAIPIAVTRNYLQDDPVPRAFGIGTNLSYSMYLYTTSSSSPPNPVDVILSDSSHIHFQLQSGTSLSNAVWTNTDSPTEFAGAVLTGDAARELFYVTLRDGTVLTFGTHPNNQLQSIKDRNGNTLTFTLSAGGSGNIDRITSTSGRYVQFTYDNGDKNYRITLATDNLGRSVSYSYDGSGRLYRVTDMNGNVEQYGYNDPADAHRMTTITDKRNSVVTTNIYDSNNRVAQQTLADGTSWYFSYKMDDTNTYVAKTTITDPRGHIEIESFNAAGYITQDVLASGEPEQRTFTYQRDSTNQVQFVTDPLGRVTHYTYDAFGDVLSITRLYGTSGAVTDNYTYDPISHLVATYTDALTRQWQFKRDSLGNLVNIVDPLTHTVTITNNSLGLPTAVVDPLNHSTQIGYQQADVSSITDALGRTFTVFTDTVGRPTTVTSPLGFTTSAGYDAMSRLLQATDPLNGQTIRKFDPNGNLTNVKDPRNAGTHSFGYDARNRVQTYTDLRSQSESYTYDGMNNVSTFTDRKQQLTQYIYDALNRVKTVTYADGSTITFNWDAGNRPESIVDSVNGTIAYQFDGLDRLMQVSTPNGTVSYTYYDNGLRNTMTATNQSQIIYCYDGANRLTSIVSGSCTGTSGVLVTLSYDDADRRSSLTLPNGVMASYGYDDADELTSLSYSRGATGLGSISYTYDGDGRRISRVSGLDQSGVPAPIRQAIYNPANQLSQWDTQMLSYDANGNVTSDGTSTYTWNSRNQLVAISGGVTASFTYDALGRRQSRVLGGVTTNFLYDGMNLIEELNGSARLANYLTGFGVDETYSRTDSTSTQSYLVDALGSIVALTNSSGTVTTSYSYDAYGNTTVSGAASANPLQYAGRESDGTGLYFYRARYYSPKFARFISEDPIRLAGGINTYAYVDGNPISWTDPWGLKPGDPFGSIPDAAVDALNWVYQTYPNANVEYAGSIYQGGDGKYYASVPQAGTRNSSKPSYGPGGYRDVDAYYHTHGQCTKGMNGGNDVFSPDDKFIADWHLPFAVPAFLETPGHQILRYDPDPKRNGGGPVSSVQPGCSCPK